MDHMGHMNHMGSSMGFFDLWSPVVLLLVVVVGLLYYNLIGDWRHSFDDSEPVSTKQKMAFNSGLILFYIGQGSPLNYIGHHYLFSAHMVQQSILYLLVPPLLLIGTPGWLIRPLMQTRFVKRWFGFFTRPLIAIFLFNIFLSVYHMPFIMDGLMANDLMHLVYNLILLFTAFAMWFPVFCPLPEWNRLSDLQKMAYIFSNGILLTPACALIIFAQEPLYSMYAHVTVPFASLDTLNDQQLGGVLMKIIQEIIYGIALAYTFFKWYRRERSEDDEYPQEMQEPTGLTTPPAGNLNRA